jgi:hypothetical protein
MRFDAPASAGYLVPVNASTVATGAAGTVTGLVDFNEYRIGTSTVWLPVDGLLLGAEVLYTKVDARGRVPTPLSNYAGETTGFFKSAGTGDIWEGRLRIQRDF